MIRKATIKDIKAIAEIYEDIHTEEEKGCGKTSEAAACQFHHASRIYKREQNLRGGLLYN